MNSMSGKKFKGIPYTGTLPAVLTGTKAGYLHRYKVYGNSSSGQECGEKTENLFNQRGTDNSGYYDNNNGQYVNDTRYKYWRFPVKEGDIIRWTTTGAGLGCYFSNGEYKGRILNTQTPFTVPADVDEITNNFRSFAWGSAMVTKNQPLPDQYIPYGYKLPLTSGSQDVDIYIGDDTLSTEEYIDSGTGKIYRMVSGTLTPVDPPAPFPQIPTSANSTTISWAGSGLAPSQFDSIQEWVDIHTYTYTNGEWVADT